MLSEVETVCDRVGIIRDGQLVTTERVHDLITQQFKRVRFQFATLPPADAFTQSGVSETAREEQSITLEIYEGLDKVMETAVRFGITDIETVPVSLEEIFLTYYGKGNGGSHV
jgi:ABC-2 type transport system ATP-binding protein